MALIAPIILPCGVQGGEVPETNRTPDIDTGIHALSADGSAALDPALSVLLRFGLGASDPLDSGAISGLAEASTLSPTDGTPPNRDGEGAPIPSEERGSLEYIVPELQGRTFSLQSGPRTFLHRLSFSPGFGQLGDEPVYTFRVAYNPNDWLGWEGSLSHNQGKSVHALFHMLNVQLRYPVPFRVQPYLSGGFGIVMVFPGASVNADPVTENALAAGGGLELYLRDDVALRAEWRRVSVFGRDPYTRDSVVYPYEEATLGMTFYRRIEP